MRGQHYDIVLNGVELGGGASDPSADVQRKNLRRSSSIPPEVVESRFGYM